MRQRSPWQQASSVAAGLFAGGVAQLRQAVARRTLGGKGTQTLPLGHWLQRFFSLRNRQFWNYSVSPRNYFFKRSWKAEDVFQAVFVVLVHLGAAAAPFFFTWKALACFCLTPKWLEYTLAYCGALAVQGPPISWVSSHRHHHGNTDAEDDVHSPRDGLWWSHMGWLIDSDGTKIRQDKRNAIDLSSQSYYRFIQRTYGWHCVLLPIILLYAFGGIPCVLWGFFARVVWFWHITWSVNSVSHVWGFQDWNTGDLSMNNWLVGILAFGEGWHNNHHAFERSCRHGLKWWQVDFTWYAIRLLEMMGLAWNLQYPSERRKQKLALT